jgi:hypothetical protein
VLVISGKPAVQKTIVVSATRAFVKSSQAEFAKVTPLTGKVLTRQETNMVGMAIIESSDIYVDTCVVQRARYNRERPLWKDTTDRMEENEVDFIVGEDEELYGTNVRSELKPEMSVELTGIDDDITGIEEWHAPRQAHEN